MLAAVTSVPAFAKDNAKGEEHVVEIRSFKFIPETLAVKPGDTIIFTNFDIAPHTATARDRSWDTGQLKRNELATVTVTDDMATDYFCLYHPNMKAALEF